MSRARLARACIALGALGLLVCAGALAHRASDLARSRAEARDRFERRRAQAGEMVRVEGRRFAIDKTEVTVRAYRECVHDGACSEPSQGDFCNFGRADRDAHPVNCVDQRQAAAFCAWAGRRLPSAEEWSIAGCSDQRHPWPGESVPKQGCFERDARWQHRGAWSDLIAPPQGTCPVDAFPESPSPHGALGMGGNVSEWTATELSESELNSHRYVVKGASWIVPRREDALFACATDRAYAPHYRDPLVGMRCARSDERSLAVELVSQL